MRVSRSGKAIDQPTPQLSEGTVDRWICGNVRVTTLSYRIVRLNRLLHRRTLRMKNYRGDMTDPPESRSRSPSESLFNLSHPASSLREATNKGVRIHYW
jgi:hypothetical protein